MLIGIISINMYSKHLNYGAALHTYAFQQYLDKLGYDNEVIDYVPRFMKKYSMKYPFLTLPPKNKKVARFLFWIVNYYPNIRKYNKFMAFFAVHFKKTKCTYDEYILKNAILKHDIIVCESDVIWSPHTTEGFEAAFFGALPSMKGIKSISYASSIGYTNFNLNRQERFRELLTNLDHISVREIQGAEFTQLFTEKPVFNVLDPTLLLDSEDYNKIAVTPKQNNYVLIYNCLKNNRTMIEDAKKYAKLHGLKVIEISVYIQNKSDHKTIVDAGIEEYLGYFKDASYVFTNAFHGVCFSIVYKKNFYTYARGTKDSRVTSILKILDIEDRFIDNEETLLVYEDIDYSNVYRCLSSEREISKNYLVNALETDYVYGGQ